MENNFSILIVEDNSGLSESLYDIFIVHGYIVETAATGVEGVDLSGKNRYDIVLVDITLPDISGIDVVEGIARLSPMTEFIYMTAQASVDSAIEAVKQKNVISYEIKPLDLDSLLALINQVVERRKLDKKLEVSENALQKSISLLSSVIESPDNIVILALDYNLNYLCFNESHATRMKKIYDIDIEIGQNIITYVPIEEDRLKMNENYKRVLNGEQFTRIAQYGPANSKIWYESIYNPIYNKSNRIIGLTVFATEITERMKMEEALRQSEKLKSIGTITAGISHEFNNILAVISGKVQLLEMTYEDNKELAKELEVIMKAADDGAAISSKMLQFTKTTENTEHLQPADITDLINQSIDFKKPRWSNEAQAGGIDYKMDTNNMKEVPPITCNPTEIREVFINIIKNALDAMPDGGSISFSTYSDENTIFACVSDTGMGMSENVKKHIFDPFFTTRTPEGTGLGMSTAYGIMTRHGGKIQVESEQGKGSMFTLQFPIHTESDRTLKTTKREHVTSNTNLSILAVDDDEEIRNILDQFLSRDGHKIKTVDNGADAIKIVESEDFDLVLCDLAMPNTFGYDVIKAINGLKRRPKIGIISGWDNESAPSGSDEVKVDFYLKKPFRHSHLARHINELFS